MKKLLCLALLVSAGSISANNKPTDNKSGNNSKDIYKKTWIDFNKNGIKDVYEDTSAPIEARIADLLSQMTLEEKTCQMATLYGSGRVWVFASFHDIYPRKRRTLRIFLSLPMLSLHLLQCYSVFPYLPWL